MNQSYNDLQTRYEENLKNGKNTEESKILKDKLEQTQQNYTTVKQKLDDLMIKLNTADSLLSKQELESNATIKRLNEKLTDIQSKRETEDKSHKSEIEKMSTENKNIRDTCNSSIETLKTQISELKTQLVKKEDTYQELHSLFEREKIIYNSKIAHLEEFRQKLSQDLSESNAKFEQAMNHFNNKNVTDKDK